MSVGQKLWSRRDDPKERVIINSQESTPDGWIVYEIVTPESDAGRTGTLRANAFFLTYEDPEAEVTVPENPPRPSSLGSVGQWRAYALMLERENEELRGDLALTTRRA